MIHRRAGRLRGGLLTLVAGACLLGTVPARTAIAGGPISLRGSLGGAPYTIRVPARWNGTLILYSHGYVIPGLLPLDNMASNAARIAKPPTTRGPPGCTHTTSSSSAQQAMSFSMSSMTCT